MPVLGNAKHEQFALLVASGLSTTKAYIKAGYSARGARQSAHALLANPDISLRIAEVTTEISKRTMAGIVSRRVADLNARVQEWQDRWEETRDALDAIIAERGEEMSGLQARGEGDEELHYVAGGSTGYIVTDYKGREANVPVYRIDSGIVQLLRVLLDIGKRAAMELGQWEGKRRLIEDDDDIVCPDLDKLTDEENVIFERLFNKAAPSKVQ
jgi:hypothetical protein